MMKRASVAALAVLFLYGSPARALTQHTRVAPPGNAGATQYQENVPSATGGVPVINLPPAGHTPQVLPPTVVTELNRAGTAGRAVVQLANRTAPAAVRIGRAHRPGAHRPGAHRRGTHRRRTHSGGSRPRGLPSDAFRLPVTSGVGSQLSAAVIGGGGGGLGLLLPAVLAGSLAVAMALVLARHRRRR